MGARQFFVMFFVAGFAAIIRRIGIIGKKPPKSPVFSTESMIGGDVEGGGTDSAEAAQLTCVR